MARATKPQVVVITGASAGVGRATARAYAARGASVGLIARGCDGLEAACREVEDLGGRAVIAPADVGDAEQVEAAARVVDEAFGPPDVWINNAMASIFSPVRETPPLEFARVTEVTYLGAVYGTLAALRRMSPRNRGAIVQVGSSLAYRGIPLQSAYCAAKHALQGFCDSLRAELLHERSGIRVSMVQLPALNTPQFDWVKSRLPNRTQPMGKVFQPELAARAIMFAADTGRREVFVTGSTVKAILANRLAAGLLDRYLAKVGFEGQQSTEPAEPDRPHNLWQPLPGDHGAHGRFGDRAKSSSWQLWATMHRWPLALLTAGAVVTAGSLARR
jgi:NAD(P)-dependent dehydrogenase (short-subunit alcohol dehydrogenase family)